MSQTEHQNLSSRTLELLPGISGGVARVMVGQPFDTIKTRLQVMGSGTAMAASLPPHMVYNDSLDCVRKMVRHEGALSLYKGLTAPLVGNMLMLGIHFPVFSKTMKALGDESATRLCVWQSLVAGGLAGAAGSLVSTPVELVRIKLQLQARATPPAAGVRAAVAAAEGGEAQMYRGSIDCMRKLLASHGIRGLYNGFASTLLRDVQGYAWFFLGYETTIHLILQHYGGAKTREDLNCWEVAAAGSAAGVGLWGSMFPIDTIKTKLQADNLSRPAYSSAMDCYRKTLELEGRAGLWRGFSAALYRALPVNAAVFLAVDTMRRCLVHMRPAEFGTVAPDGHGSKVEGNLGYFSQNAATP